MNLKRRIANFFLSSLFTEMENQTKNVKKLTWDPQYCVLHQDEQTFSAYCSEELSVSVLFFYLSLSLFVYLYKMNTLF